MSKESAALRVVFLGTHNWKAHEAVRWWNAAHAQGDRAAEDAAAPRRRVDVFGIARPELPDDAAHLARLQWLALRPGSDTRVAGKAGVQGVACSGAGPNDVQVVKDCRAAGKAVFVESLERFSPADLADLARACARAPGRPLMTGLYLRFDAALQQVAELGGAPALVGRPLLYHAHACTVPPALLGQEAAPGGLAFPSRMHIEPVTPTLFDLGMQQVDALRWLLGTEPTEVYAVGVGGAAQAGRGSQAQGGGASAVNAFDIVTMTIKTSSGALAAITLDASGNGGARQRVQIVGDSNRATLAGKASAADLQTAAISHFMDVVTAGGQPRMGAIDCLRAAATMAAAAESLRSGAPVAVDFAFSAAGERAVEAATDGAGPAANAGAVAATVKDAAASLAACAKKLAQAAGVAGEEEGDQESGEEGGVSTPPHQRTPPPKAVGTPESPPLQPATYSN